MTEKILAAAVVNALSDGQGQFPWGDDIESWLEVRDAAEIAADIRAYASAEADRAAAEERERCASLCENWPTPDCGGWTLDGLSEAIRAGA